MKFIFPFLILMSTISLAQNKAHKIVEANGQKFEFDDSATIEQIGSALDEYFSGKLKQPLTGKVVPKGKIVSEWGEEVFDKPPIVEKEWNEPIKEEVVIWAKNPWEIAAEEERANKIDILYKVLSNDENYSILIGDESTFKDKMKNPNKVKILYKALLKDEKYANTISNLLSNEEDAKLSNIDSIPNASELVLDENRRLQLDSILKKMAANGESYEDILFVAKDFKSKYGVLKSKKNKSTFSMSSKFFKELKKLALPITTIFVLVFLCYKLLKNITLAKIKVALKSNQANRLYKIAGITAFVSAIVLYCTNPTLKEFEEITPSKLVIEKNNGFCESEWKLSHTKVKNYFFCSYYKFSFGCSEYQGYKKKYKIEGFEEYTYLGIFNNFYRVEY